MPSKCTVVRRIDEVELAPGIYISDRRRLGNVEAAAVRRLCSPSGVLADFSSLVKG